MTKYQENEFLSPPVSDKQRSPSIVKISSHSPSLMAAGLPINTNQSREYLYTSLNMLFYDVAGNPSLSPAISTSLYQTLTLPHHRAGGREVL